MGIRISKNVYQYMDDVGHLRIHTEAASREVCDFVEDPNPGKDPWGTTKNYQIYDSADYRVTVRRYRKGFFISNAPYIILGIGRHDDMAIHDWRDMQQIKSALAGPHYEGIELYPDESRLVDTSNYFYMWCVKRGVLRFGLPSERRVVLSPHQAAAPQRPFPGDC